MRRTLNANQSRKRRRHIMPSISGSFSGRITQQYGLPLNDQSNHLLAIAEVNGTQNSPDPLWNDSTITYWGVNDLLNGEGAQTGYFNNVHPDGGRDFGTFKAVAKSETEIEATWNGAYKLAKAQAG